MDERLAVEAHFAALFAFVAEAVEVSDVVVDAVENVAAVARAAATQSASQVEKSRGRG